MARVLLVEDDDLNRDMLSRRLQRCGYDIVVAADGIQGLAAARTSLPDLVLLDLSLPLLDGWGMLRQLRSEILTRAIPVIALTAHAMAADRDRALAEGFDDYETKPIDLPGLRSKMDALLCRKVPA